VTDQEFLEYVQSGGQVETEDPREAGPVHVGHQMWRVLGLDTILADAGLSARTRQLTEIMTLNRLVSPAAEHAMPDWIRRTALGDILATDFTALADDDGDDGDNRVSRNAPRIIAQ